MSPNPRGVTNLLSSDIQISLPTFETDAKETVEYQCVVPQCNTRAQWVSGHASADPEQNQDMKMCGAGFVPGKVRAPSHTSPKTSILAPHVSLEPRKALPLK